MEKIQVRLFGGLTVKLGNKFIVNPGSHLNKPLELFALLLLSRAKPLTNEQLMACLWENDEAENPAGALKNAAYSLRQLLQKEAGNFSFVTTVDHHYCWNPKVPLDVDLWRFEEVTAALNEKGNSLSGEEQLRLGREAVELYAGDFLPLLSGRQWVVQEAGRLRRLYFSAIKHTSLLLLEKGDHASLEEVLSKCSRAIMLDPLCEDIYLYLFRAMKALELHAAILNYYPVVSNLFLDELNQNLPDEIRKIYLWASGSAGQPMEDIHQIRQDLDEVTRNLLPISGAYYCPYEVFKHAFHMVVRSASRAENRVMLMLLTLSDERGYSIPKTELAKIMIQLKGTVQKILRKGDVFSRYSRSQYILMLSVRSPSDCPAIGDRIRKAFVKINPPSYVKLSILTAETNPLL